MTWDDEFDVVCVGSGVGGLTTAAAAAEMGARVLVVEKDDKAGGVTARSGGQLWIGATELEHELGIEDSLDETRAYLVALSQGSAVPALQDVYVDKGSETVDFLRDVLGVPLFVIRDLPDYYYPLHPGSKAEGRYLEVSPFDASMLGKWSTQSVVSPYDDLFTYVTFAEILEARAGTGPALADLLPMRVVKDLRCAGAGLTGWLMKAAFDRSVELQVSTRAVRLVAGDVGVEGVVLDSGSGRSRVRARLGVLLATGGYDWNPDLMRSLESLEDAGSMAPVTIEGDHLTMAAEFGAFAVAARETSQTPIFVGYEVPGRKVDGRPMFRCWSPGHPYSFIVNQSGRRFADDGFYPDVVSKVGGRDRDGTPNWPAWLIFDQKFVATYGLPPIPPGGPIPEVLAISAGSASELACAAGIDEKGLQATLDSFNDFCPDGIDREFGRGSRPWTRVMIGNRNVRPNPNLGSLTEPPFYAVKLRRVAMGCPSSGLATNSVGQVLDADAAPVSGLFAVGNSAAWLDIGGGYNSGIANSRGAIFGLLAARAMTS